MFTKNSQWDKNKYKDLKKYLNILSEEKYKKFNQKLVTTKYKIIGIRIPILRKIAKEINKTNIASFLEVVEDNSFEEVLLQGLVISNIKDINNSIKYFNKFILKIDNWSICDTCVSSMKIVNKYKDIYWIEINKYLNKSTEFTVRVGIVLLLNYYVEDAYIDKILDIIDNIHSDKYYINMAIAWLISVCFVKQKDKTYYYLTNNELDNFTYNKAIQKIIESFRVSDKDKIILKKMKRV